MKKINKIISHVKDIHWPTKKVLLQDTMFTVSVAGILAIAILIWTSGIEYVIGWLASIF
jgi:preprotein translocase subunit SecE